MFRAVSAALFALFLAAAWTGIRAAEFPAASSKKGLQVEMVDDAIALGVKQAALNLNLTALALKGGETNGLRWKHAGKDFYFRESYLRAMDDQVKRLSAQGILVYMIVLTYASGDPEIDRLVLHPGYAKSAPNHLGAFNTATPEGEEWFSACMEFLAARWSDPNREHGRAVGYIMGNEVNSHWWWSNMGRVPMEKFADEYLKSVRLAHRAIRKQANWPRVYLSLEHHWNIRYPAGDEMQCFPGRPFLEYFAAQAKAGGDFDWDVAFHPYPENLFEPRFWNDKTATTNENTARITFKNIEMLPRFLARPEMLFEGKPRRIILSEQGFHTPKGPKGEAIQAAAYCYAYKKIESIPEIDAFILHRHVDNAHEGGLLLGLRSNVPGAEPRPQKLIYDCFRKADTADWEEAFKFALPIIGLEAWPR